MYAFITCTCGRGAGRRSRCRVQRACDAARYATAAASTAAMPIAGGCQACQRMKPEHAALARNAGTPARRTSFTAKKSSSSSSHRVFSFPLCQSDSCAWHNGNRPQADSQASEKVGAQRRLCVIDRPLPHSISNAILPLP